MRKEFFLIDALEKRQGSYGNSLMFSARFENIKELKGFLKFSSNLVATNAPETLGVAYTIWKSILKGRETWELKK